jgi:glucosamine--fructose-6-phosphate aminotransferase (isomerizing)
MDVKHILAKVETDLQNTLHKFDDKNSAFILGSGKAEAIAREGALKIKEISYIHCEGCSSSSLKHGPFALLTPEFPVIILVPDIDHFDKNEGVYHEVKSRGACVVYIASPTVATMTSAENVIVLPENKTFSDLLCVIYLQWIAYKMALRKGINPDYPKNLAKVVTV